MICAHTHDLTAGCSPVVLWVCGAPHSQLGRLCKGKPARQRVVPPRDSLYGKDSVQVSFFLFIIDKMMSWFLKGKYAHFSLLTKLLRPDVRDFLSYHAILTLTAQS